MSWIDRIENAVENYNKLKFNWFDDNFDLNTTKKDQFFLKKLDMS